MAAPHGTWVMDRPATTKAPNGKPDPRGLATSRPPCATRCGSEPSRWRVCPPTDPAVGQALVDAPGFHTSTEIKSAPRRPERFQALKGRQYQTACWRTRVELIATSICHRVALRQTLSKPFIATVLACRAPTIASVEHHPRHPRIEELLTVRPGNHRNEWIEGSANHETAVLVQLSRLQFVRQRHQAQPGEVVIGRRLRR